MFDAFVRSVRCCHQYHMTRPGWPGSKVIDRGWVMVSSKGPTTYAEVLEVYSRVMPATGHETGWSAFVHYGWPNPKRFR